jgi:hypothetical protein
VDTQAAATPVVAVSSMPLDLGAAAAPSQALRTGRRLGWSRLALLIGGSAILLASLGWLAFQILKLG